MTRFSRRAAALWRRSLQLRVVTTTTVFSLIAVLALGSILVTRVRDGLLDAKRASALAESTSGTRTAQEAFDSADRSVQSVFDTLVPDLVRQKRIRHSLVVVALYHFDLMRRA